MLMLGVSAGQSHPESLGWWGGTESHKSAAPQDYRGSGIPERYGEGMKRLLPAQPPDEPEESDGQGCPAQDVPDPVLLDGEREEDRLQGPHLQVSGSGVELP